MTFREGYQPDKGPKNPKPPKGRSGEVWKNSGLNIPTGNAVDPRFRDRIVEGKVIEKPDETSNGSRRIPLDSLTSVEYNPRSITDEELSRLKASIAEGTKLVKDWDPNGGYRLNGTILINVRGNRIVGGNQRVRALRELGQDWIHREDVTWIDCAPGSLEEKERNVTLNNPHVAGDWTDGVVVLLAGLPQAFQNVGLLELQRELTDRFKEWTSDIGGVPDTESPMENLISLRVEFPVEVLPKIREDLKAIVVLYPGARIVERPL